MRRVADVETDPRSADLVGQRGERVVAQARDDDGGAAGSEGARRCRADPMARARDDCDLPGQLHCVSLSGGVTRPSGRRDEVHASWNVAILSALSIVNQGSPFGATVIPSGSLPLTAFDCRSMT